MNEEFAVGTAIRTTGAVRHFTDQPVDRATLHAVLDDARFAPSGGNRQGWRVIIVDNLDTRRAIGTMMQRVWDEYRREGASGRTPFAVTEKRTLVDAPAPHVQNPLVDAIADVPLVLVITADLNMISMMDSDADRPAITGGASIYPFCWNLLLAARSRGLGGVLTTFLARAEREAAPLLGLPEQVAIAGTIFLGHPVHQPTKLSRRPVEAFTTLDTYGGEVFRG